MRICKAKKWKVAVSAVTVAICIFLTWTVASMTARAYEQWQLNQYSVQERLYEAVDMFFAYALILVLCLSALVFSICRLVSTLRPAKNAGRITRFIRRHGVCPVLVFAALSVILCLLDHGVLARIAATPEISEVPASLSDHVLSGWLHIATVLTAECAILAMISWLRNRHRKAP